MSGKSDAELAGLIHADRIDILVDLAGHTSGNRLGAFTYRPAPVQATYLGFFATTGLEAMDYWITDAVLHPADTPEQIRGTDLPVAALLGLLPAATGNPSGIPLPEHR